jgi:tetratricopeptide (TPR) repeat protein
MCEPVWCAGRNFAANDGHDGALLTRQPLLSRGSRRLPAGDNSAGRSGTSFRSQRPRCRLEAPGAACVRAIRCYTAALLGIDPDLPLALINRGSLLEGQGQRAEAMADFKRVIEAQAKLLQASPSDGDALCMRGASSNRAEQLHAALGDLSRTMIEVLPSGPKTRGKALRHRVEVLLKLGRYDEAVADLDACLATDPLSPVAQSLRGGRTVASLSRLFPPSTSVFSSSNQWAAPVPAPALLALLTAGYGATMSTSPSRTPSAVTAPAMWSGFRRMPSCTPPHDQPPFFSASSISQTA